MFIIRNQHGLYFCGFGLNDADYAMWTDIEENATPVDEEDTYTLNKLDVLGYRYEIVKAQ